MTDGLVLALAQLNPVMGDIAGNVEKLRAIWRQAAEQGAHLLMTPELFLCGYPPQDLVVKPSFHKALQTAIDLLVKDTEGNGTAILLGTPWMEGGRVYNAMLLLAEGQIAAKIYKRDLPNYGPFDEKRTLAAGPLPEPVAFRGINLGIMICEDMWTPAAAAHLKQQGAEILLVPNGSPFETDKQSLREQAAKKRVAETCLPLIYLNQIGGQDELVFDGASFVVSKAGDIVLRAKNWDEHLFFVDIPSAIPVQSPSRSREGLGAGGEFSPLRALDNKGWIGQHLGPPLAPPVNGREALTVSASQNSEATIYNALMLGLRDYVGKNGFSGVVLGLSGGIDSALAAALAVDALGAENVWCVMLPSPFTSRESFEDATALANNLKCRYDIMPINTAMQSFDGILQDAFSGKNPDVTEENIQARCRGIILMALSNKFGPMVLSTGNKSEMSVGYSTLYGDLCGGFAVLKDLYKTEVYKISAWRNAHRPEGAHGPTGTLIPERIFSKAPTAELRAGQTDQDTLPPYNILDDILQGLIEQDASVAEIAARGHDAALVKRVASMLNAAEYKRRQAPPGVKITRRIHGIDRRYPITNRYRES